jgi:hypothetical protein
MVDRGEITEAISAAAILKTQLLGLTRQLPDGIAEAL